MTTNSFYAEMPPFQDFQQLSTDAVYRSVPGDWYVVISDVQGSTDAIAQGRYREVNTVGAAAIVLMQSVMKSEPLAFVFGGDGATFLIPPGRIDEAKTILAQYKQFCAQQFQMQVRVGLVPVSEILEAGQKLEIAKFAALCGRCTVMIRGGGLVWAEYSIKSSPRKYSLKEQDSKSDLPLAGLSCRWQPIQSGKGRILTLLVQPRLFDTTQVFEKLLSEISKIVGGSLENANPVQVRSFRYGGFWSTMIREWKLVKRKRPKDLIKWLIEIVFCQWMFRFRLPASEGVDVEKYIRDIPAHSDYRKYDDALRLVLDCAPVEIDQIHACLKAAFDRGEIFFGAFESTHALMTCLVENLREGGHIHLIDGSDGGYTIAAQRLGLQRAGDAPGVAV